MAFSVEFTIVMEMLSASLSESTEATTAPISVESATTIAMLRAPERATTSTPATVERRTCATECEPRRVMLPATAQSTRSNVMPTASNVTLRVPVALSMTSVMLSEMAVIRRSVQPTACVSLETAPSGHGAAAESAASSSKNHSSGEGITPNALPRLMSPP